MDNSAILILSCIHSHLRAASLSSSSLQFSLLFFWSSASGYLDCAVTNRRVAPSRCLLPPSPSSQGLISTWSLPMNSQSYGHWLVRCLAGHYLISHSPFRRSHASSSTVHICDGLEY